VLQIEDKYNRDLIGEPATTTSTDITTYATNQKKQKQMRGVYGGQNKNKINGVTDSRSYKGSSISSILERHFRHASSIRNSIVNYAMQGKDTTASNKLQISLLHIPKEIRDKYPRLYSKFLNRQRDNYFNTQNGETKHLYNNISSFIDFMNQESVKMFNLKSSIHNKIANRRNNKQTKSATMQNPELMTLDQKLSAQEQILKEHQTTEQRLQAHNRSHEQLQKIEMKQHRSGAKKEKRTKKQMAKTLRTIIRGQGSTAEMSFTQAVLEPLFVLNKALSKLDSKLKAEKDHSSTSDIEAAITWKTRLPQDLRTVQMLSDITLEQAQIVQKDLISIRRSLEICESLIELNPKRVNKKKELILNLDKNGQPRDPKDYFTKSMIFNYKRIKKEAKTIMTVTKASTLKQAINTLYQMAELSVLHGSTDYGSSDIIAKSLAIAIGIGIVPIAADISNKLILNACREQKHLLRLYEWHATKKDIKARTDFIRAINKQRAKTFSIQKEQEVARYLADKVEFDGDSFVAKPFAANTGVDELLSKETEPDQNTLQFKRETEQLTQRAFDSSDTAEPALEFRFKFKNERVAWDPQIRKFNHIDKLFAKDRELQEQTRSARPAQPDSYEATFFYLYTLKNTFPLEYNLLRTNGFMGTSTDHDEYTKQCKAFTSQLKYCYTALIEKGYTPTVLFELEQLTGFRTANIELDWKTNIGDWVSQKNNMDTPLAAVIAQKSLARNLPADLLAKTQITDAILDDAAIYNASGTAKGEAVKVPMWHEIDSSIPARMRMNKTSYNLSIDWKERDRMTLGNTTMYGYPIQKKEVTKVRYIVNTDLSSHFQLSPVEALIAKIAKQSQIYNMRSPTLQDQDKRDWTTKPMNRMFFCADQSSFDNNISAHSFLHSFNHFVQHTTGRFQFLSRIIFRKYQSRAIYVMDKANVTRWLSGMLSGWKITSQFDSLINLQQMQYTTDILRQLIESARVLGDDVIMTAEKIDTAAIVVAMNQQGLTQHPDKTITSTRYAEFLRYLYDSQTRQVRAYPTRLVPSILFNKPWNNPYMEDEWEGNSAMARLKVFRTFARRLGLKSDDKFIMEMCAADITNKQGSLTSIKVTAEQLQAPVLQVEVTDKRINNDDIRKLVDTLSKMPTVTPDQIKQGRLRIEDVARSMALNYSTANKTFISKIIKHQVGVSLAPMRVATVEPVRVAPFPRPWIKKLAHEIENQNSRMAILGWGDRSDQIKNLESQPLLQKMMIQSILMESKYKDEDIIVINVSEPTVATQMQNIKTVANQEPTVEKANQKYKELMIQTDWLRVQLLNVATNNVFD
jgi:hypothetical protein